MKFKKISTIACSFALGVFAMTSCEGSDMYSIGSPDWLADSIAAAKGAGGGEEEELIGMQEDVYTVGATDFSTGWWSQFSKYYQIPDGAKFNVVFNLSINPNASNTYKNFAMIISNDVDRGGAGYAEYGAIRFDNQPSGNSEWGDYIDRSKVNSTLTFNTDTDGGVDKLGGRVVVTIDRTNPDDFIVKMTNGTVTKTYVQGTGLSPLNPDGTNSPIRVFFVPEGSYLNFLQANIEPIGGYTSAEDKEPLSMTLKGAPKKVLQGATIEEAFANVTATVQFEQEVSKDVTAADLTFQTVPDMNTLGTKTLVAVYNKTYKGEGAAKPVIASVQFEVVDKMFTSVGATDNSTPFWGAHSDNIKVGPKETFVSTFTNYTSGANNWNNFCVVLCSADGATEYAVVRADNYGWGNGYAACTPVCDNGGDWATWLKAMDGAKVTAYITNNGNGTADVKCVIIGSDGKTYKQEYNGINTVDPNNCYFNLTVDNSHIEFDTVIGEENNSTAFWGAHSQDVNVPVGKTVTQRFRNYTTGANNWNNFCVVLTREDNTEYAVVRADNFGWGASYDGNASLELSGGQADWGAWLAAMDDALVTVSTTNKGGSVNVDIVMKGNNGVEYKQYYHNITPTDGDNVRMRFTVDGCHLVFE
jgi:hypothetical protein